MDLVKILAAQLGVDPNQAQAVAGAVLGQVQQVATSQGDESSAEAIGAAVPELGDWKQKAASSLGVGGTDALTDLFGQLTGGGDSDDDGGGGLLAGLAEAAGSGLGNQLLESVAGKEVGQQAQLVGLLSQLGIGADKAALVVPTVLTFLKERLSDDMVEQLLKAAPMLAAAGGSGGGVGGMLSGLFGKN